MTSSSASGGSHIATKLSQNCRIKKKLRKSPTIIEINFKYFWNLRAVAIVTISRFWCCPATCCSYMRLWLDAAGQLERDLTSCVSRHWSFLSWKHDESFEIVTSAVLQGCWLVVSLLKSRVFVFIIVTWYRIKNFI